MIKWLNRLLCLAFVGAIALTSCGPGYYDSGHEWHCGLLLEKWQQENDKYPFLLGLTLCEDGTRRVLVIDSITFTNTEKGQPICGTY